MGRIGSRVALAAVLVVVTGYAGPARSDDSSGAQSTDAVAKKRADEFEELQKKDTSEAANKRLEIVRGLAFAPCVTARRFTLGILKKASAPGDERVVALQTLLHIADDSAFEAVLATLTHDKDPTLWRVFAESVGSARSDPVRNWMKGPALSTRDPDALGAVLDAFALKPDASAADRIEAIFAKHAKPPGSPDLAARALRALWAAKPAPTRAAVLEAGRHPDARMRLVAADFVPSLDPFDADAEAVTKALLADEATAVRQTAIVRVGGAKRASLASSLVALLADPRARTRHVAAVALEQATGQKLGHDPKAWAAWLEKKDPGKPDEITVPTYHGLPVRSDRVVFLVDGSSSMAWPWRKPTHRIDVARAELASVLKQISPEIQFNVAVYASKVAWFRKAESPATAENVAAALQWAEKALATPAGDTHLFEALDAVYAVDPQFDTVYLLTDGNPTHGRYWSTPSLLASVYGWNRNRRAAIHTIGLSLAQEDPGMPNLAEDLGAMSALLSALAAATGGEYREVLTVPKAK